MTQSPAGLPQPAFNALRTLVLYSLAEFQGGHATTLRVSANGERFAVADDGRGHAIARSVAGAPYLPFIYTHLDYPFAGGAAPIQLQGLAMSLLNTMCSELDISVRKRNALLQMSYRHGELNTYQVTDVVSSETGNHVAATLDPRLSANAATVESADIDRWLRGLLLAHPTLQLWFNDQRLYPPAAAATVAAGGDATPG